MQFHEGKLRGPVDGHEHMQLALFGPHLGDIDVEVADRVALELLLCRPVALDIGQTTNAMALQAAMQRRSRQVRDRRLQRVEAVVERQQSVAPERDDDRLFLRRQHRRAWLFGTSWQVGDRSALLPFGHGLLVDPMALGERPQARLTMLYRSTDRLCRRGAPMENLAHSASFDSELKGAPSKPGIKHLECPVVARRAPREHRTDSLSASFCNLDRDARDDLTRR
jgi:hypothetical protein